MVSQKHSRLLSKIKCPSCNKGLIYHEIDSNHKDGVLIHVNQFAKDCDKIFPVINEILILIDYKFWPIIPFNSYLIRNKGKLPKKYLDSFLIIKEKIRRKSFDFNNEIEKKHYNFIKFQQDLHPYSEEKYKSWLNIYSNELIEGRANKFVNEYSNIKHCKNEKIFSGDWLLSICSGGGYEILALNKYLNQYDVKIKNVLNDIRFLALMKAKKIMQQCESYFILSNSQIPPFYDSSFDICYVHDGLHHLPNPPGALVNLGKITSRLIFVSEAQENRVLKFLKIQHEEPGGVEYRFSREEIYNILSPNFKNIKIHTAFIQKTLKIQRIIKKFNFIPFYIGFRIIFIIVNGIIGRFGNLMQISADKKP